MTANANRIQKEIAHSEANAPAMQDTRNHFIAAMANAVTGVNLVTTDGPMGRCGVTVSAMTSVSADPPMVLVCINANSYASGVIDKNGVFCVNVLGAGQRRIAEVFAGVGKLPPEERFARGEWEAGESGSPALVGSVATFDCAVYRSYTAGSHRIFVGEVLQSREGDGEALLYSRRRFGRPMFTSH